MYEELLKNLKIFPYLLSLFWEQKEKKLRFFLILAPILMALSIALNIGLPIILKRVVTIFSQPKEYNQSIYILLSYGTIWILSQITLSLRELCIFRVIENCIRNLNMQFVSHLHKLSVEFYANHKTGELTSSLERALSAIPMLIYGLFFLIIPTTIEVIIVIVLFWKFYGFLHASILFGILIFFITFSIIGSKKAFHYRRHSNEINQKVNSLLIETLLNFEIIHYFNNQSQELKNYNDLLKQREKKETKSFSFLEFLHIGQSIIMGLGFITLTLITGREVLSGKASVGDLVLVNGFLLQFFTPLSSFGYMIRSAYKSFTDMEGIFKIINTPPKIKEPNQAPPIISKNGSIVFKNVTFGYNNNPTPILKNVSFEILPGQKIALAGPSGAGKSTITKLFYRFYDILEGEILINGQNIKNVQRASIAKIIGIVPQDTTLFNNTIGYNIAYGRARTSHKEIVEVAHKARLDRLIESLPEKYETLVGERGAKLSGGEKQRIAIARVLLKNPDFYIFDEATSSLDKQTAESLLYDFNEICKNKTALIISHNPSNLIKIDKTLMLKDGTLTSA